MNAAYLYLQLYRLFDDATPVPFDCGRACGRACCRGDDSGMLLFPGEETVFSLLKPSWASIEYSDLTYFFNEKEYRVPILFCKGSCDRYQRPLSCRIFPLTPYLDKNGKLVIKNDPRAKSICPLPLEFEPQDYERTFADNVRKASKLLLFNPRIAASMEEYSRYLDEFERFF